MPTLEAPDIRRAAGAYAKEHPLARVEDDRLETLPDAFYEGTFHWKDAEWVVRWWSRRELDGGSRDRERPFRRNEMAALETAIESVVGTDALQARLEYLTSLEGVDVELASAFLQFIDPADYAVIDRRSWTVLANANRVTGEFPTPVDEATYERFLTSCRDLSRNTLCPVIDIGRALWWIEWTGAENANSRRQR